jgi:streptomycin 6-kinase
MISIPNAFAERIKQIHGSKGVAWIESLPEVVSFCEHKWDIKILEPFSLSYNFVAPVKFNNGTQGVLKLCIPGKECSSELGTLKVYEGVSMCRLIDGIEERGVLLIERLKPGDNLKTVEYDVAAVKIASMLMKKMRDKSATTKGFQTIEDWAEGISKMRTHYNGGSGPFSESVVQEVEELFPKLITSQKNCYLLHGDLHHENILLNNGEWKLIDPKGIVGEVEYEVVPFIVNNLPDHQFEKLIDQRIQIFSKELGASIDRVYGWGLCHSLLSAWWNIEDNLVVSDRHRAVIEHFHSRRNGR